MLKVPIVRDNGYLELTLIGSRHTKNIFTNNQITKYHMGCDDF